MRQILILVIIYSLSGTSNIFGQWYNIADLPFGSYHDIQLYSNGIGYVIGEEYIYKSSDGGISWDSTRIGGSLDALVEFDFINQDTGFIVGDMNDFQGFYTEDQGSTWIPFVPNIFYSQVAMINGNEVVVGRYPAEPAIYILNLSELSVETIILEGGAGSSDIQVFPEDTIYVGGGAFGKSFDKGANWVITEMPGIINMNFPTSRVGYSTFDDLLYKTNDFGDTWIKLELPYYFDACGPLEFSNDSIGYYSCTKDSEYYGVIKTQNGGNDWIYNEFVPPVVDFVVGISCVSPDTCWCLTYSGQIYKTTNGGGEALPPSTLNEMNSIPVVIYPIPATEDIHIHFDGIVLPSQISTYNSFGQMIELSFDNELRADVESMEPGLYVTQIQCNSRIYLCRWIKL